MPITDLTLPQLVAALSLVDSFVASSTGPLHIAAIVSRSAVRPVQRRVLSASQALGTDRSGGERIDCPLDARGTPLRSAPHWVPSTWPRLSVDMVVERMRRPVAEALCGLRTAKTYESQQDPPHRRDSQSHIGDVICALPAFEALRRGLPMPRSRPSSTEQIAPILNTIPTLTTFCLTIIWPGPTIDRGLAIRPVRCGVGRHVHARNCWAALRAGIPIRVTECRAWKPALCGTHRATCRGSGRPITYRATFSPFTERLGIPFALEQHRPYLFVDSAEQAKIEQRIEDRLGDQGPLLAVHPGNRKSAYNWPVENYFEIIKRLAGVGRVLITGTEYDRKWSGLDRPAAHARVAAAGVAAHRSVDAADSWRCCHSSTFFSLHRPDRCTSPRSFLAARSACIPSWLGNTRGVGGPSGRIAASCRPPGICRRMFRSVPPFPSCTCRRSPSTWSWSECSNRSAGGPRHNRTWDIRGH